MTPAEIRKAYREFNRASREAFKLRRHIEEADRLIAKFHERKLVELANRYQDDAAFLRVIRAFTGHTPYGWRCACGNDGRMKKLVDELGWDVLAEVVRRVRWRRYAPKGAQAAGAPSQVTVEITIK